MNREETKKAIEVMQAYVDGKNIEFLSTKGWRDAGSSETGTPEWDWVLFEYRIKPEPMEIEVWIKGKHQVAQPYDPPYLENFGYVKKKFREVLE